MKDVRNPRLFIVLDYYSKLQEYTASAVYRCATLSAASIAASYTVNYNRL